MKVSLKNKSHCKGKDSKPVFSHLDITHTEYSKRKQRHFHASLFLNIGFKTQQLFSWIIIKKRTFIMGCLS